MTLRFLLPLALSIAFVAITHAQEQLQLSEFFPSGKIELEFLDVSMSKRGTELAAKFAGRTDNEWLQKYITEVAQPGKQLPYHPNFGLTEAEYNEFLSASKQMAVQPIGVTWECTIKVEDKIVSFEPIGHSSPRLTSIRFKIDSVDAKASGQYLGKGEWRTHDGKGSAIGPWRGYLWKKEIGDETKLASGGDFELYKLDILHLVGTEYAFMSHKFAERKAGKQPVSQEFMLRFRSPALAK